MAKGGLKCILSIQPRYRRRDKVSWQNSGGVEIFSNLPNLQERLQKQRLKLQAYLLNLCDL